MNSITMEKYLIINPFGIGDALFTAPLIKALKIGYPDCFIGYWCNERVGELLKSVPDINKVFPLSRGDIKRVYKGVKGADKGLSGISGWLKGNMALISLISQIRRERFDVAFDFSLDSRYGLWSKLAGIKKRIGFDYKGRGRLLTDKINLVGYSGKHVVEHNLDLLKFIGIKTSTPGLEMADKGRTGRGCFEVSEESRIKVKKILAEHGITATDLLIGVAPGGGASWGKDAIYKQWPVGKFAELISALRKMGQSPSGTVPIFHKVVLLGSADEKPIAEIVAGKMGQSLGAANGQTEALLGTVPIFLDLTGRLSLKELAAVISELKLLICNDGGPLHMAVALGVKTVAMFGPVDEKVYGPYPSNEKHVVIKKDLSCRPCYKDFRFAGCPNNRKCLEDISVDEVFEKVKSLL